MRKHLLFCVILFACTYSSVAKAQTYDLQFTTEITDCTYCATVEISAPTTPFNLGGLSYVFDFNANALQYLGFTSLNFDENAVNCSGQGNVFIAQDPFIGASAISSGVTPTIPGFFSGFVSCPVIGADWVPLAEYCFDIIDPTLDSDLEFSPQTNQHIALISQDLATIVPTGILTNTNESFSSCMIPTVGEWGLICLTLLSLILGLCAIENHSTASTSSKPLA